MLNFDAIKVYDPEAAITGVLKKRCSENMHQIYSRTSMAKCELVTLFKSHFGMGVLL